MNYYCPIDLCVLAVVDYEREKIVALDSHRHFVVAASRPK